MNIYGWSAWLSTAFFKPDFSTDSPSDSEFSEYSEFHKTLIISANFNKTTITTFLTDRPLQTL